MEYCNAPAGPVGFCRFVAPSGNPLRRECFIANWLTRGHDPLEYRRRLLSRDSGELKVLEAIAKLAHWHELPPPGVHRGLAVTEAFGSYTAALAELSVSGKRVDLKRLVVGIDPGHVVNPDNVVAQMQGSAAFMLSALCWGEITIKDGRVAQSNSTINRMLRLREMPRWRSCSRLQADSGAASASPASLRSTRPSSMHCSPPRRRVRSLPLKNAGFDFG